MIDPTGSFVKLLLTREITNLNIGWDNQIEVDSRRTITNYEKKRSLRKTVFMENWYDYPQYFDMIFRDETASEVQFFEQAFKHFGLKNTKHLLEPGCGSGRLVTAMARQGYKLTGLDLSQPMLNYLRRRLSRNNLNASVITGDMTTMRLGRKFDAAFCTFNTFRHLLNENDTIAHLRSVANHLHSGGIYILGFHIIPLDADPESTERLTASHGGTKVSVTLKVIDFQRRRRQEQIRVNIKAVTRQGKVHRIKSEFPLRLYTHLQVQSLLKKVNVEFEIAGVYDFDYDLEYPRRIDEDLTDAVFVLRRK